MKLPANTQKWATAGLGVLSLLLLVNLVARLRATRATDSRPPQAVRSAPRARLERASAPSSDDLERYDPFLHLEALKELDARPLPDPGRNLFDFVAPPLPKVNPAQQAAVQAAAPPPPQPILLKPVGYNEMPGGVKQAFVSYGNPPDDQTVVVREGDVVMSRYKILKITPTVVTVEDANAHQTADLPIPQ